MAQSRSAALHDQLLRAALGLFAAHGFRGTSLQDIATEAGCSKASLLYHFANKEAILAELMAPATAAMDVLLEQLADVPDDEVPVAAVEGFVDLALEYRDQISLLLSDTQEAVRKSERGEPDNSEPLLDALSGRSGLPQDRLRAWLALGGIVIATAAGPRLDHAETREVLINSALQALGAHG